MKSVVMSVILAAAVITGSVIYTNVIDGVSAEMSGINKEIAACIETDDYNTASGHISGLKELIEKKSVLLEAMGNHAEVDEIIMNVYELERYTQGENKTDALSKCAVLGFLFGHLAEEYHLKPENIL